MLAKQDVLKHCIAHVQNRIKEIDLAIADVQSSLFSETKSSAGDKYETSREMLQQDLNRFQNQLLIAENDKLTLESIDYSKKLDAIRHGALFRTEQSYYFIAISVGRLEINSQTVFVISAESPIGKSVLGLKVDNYINFNNLKDKIVEIS